MAMLAEKRSKQKWSEDPRNIAWSSDKDRYGYQMLEKMGWADGKGLGSKQNGSTSHVKIKKRKQNLGLGAKETHDKDWIAHQEDFNNLLSALNQHGGNAELKTEEENKKAMFEVAKASRKRVFYKKFIRSKDASQYSEKDLACIIGTKKNKSAPATPQGQSEDDSQSDDSSTSCPTVSQNSSADCGFVTYTSKQNIQEYFARRMKEKKAEKGIEKTEGKVSKRDKDCEEFEVKSFCEEKENKKAKKSKRTEVEDEKKFVEEDGQMKRKKRRRKKVNDLNGKNRENRKDVNGEDSSVQVGGLLKNEIEAKRKKSKKKSKKV